MQLFQKRDLFSEFHLSEELDYFKAFESHWQLLPLETLQEQQCVILGCKTIGSSKRLNIGTPVPDRPGLKALLLHLVWQFNRKPDLGQEISDLKIYRISAEAYARTIDAIRQKIVLQGH